MYVAVQAPARMYIYIYITHARLQEQKHIQRVARLESILGTIRGITPRRRGATALPTPPATPPHRNLPWTSLPLPSERNNLPWTSLPLAPEKNDSPKTSRQRLVGECLAPPKVCRAPGPLSNGWVLCPAWFPKAAPEDFVFLPGARLRAVGGSGVCHLLVCVCISLSLSLYISIYIYIYIYINLLLGFLVVSSVVLIIYSFGGRCKGEGMSGPCCRHMGVNIPAANICSMRRGAC